MIFPKTPLPILEVPHIEITSKTRASFEPKDLTKFLQNFARPTESLIIHRSITGNSLHGKVEQDLIDSLASLGPIKKMHMKLEHSGERIIEAAFRFKVQDLKIVNSYY
jgi:hypothetical protein